MKIIFVKDDYVVPSGSTVTIQAYVQGASNKKEEKLLWAAEKGSVDGNGRYKSPETTEDTDDQVTAVCAEDDSVKKTFSVSVIAKKEKIPIFAQKMEVRKVGSEGQYSVNIQVVSNKGVGYKCDIVISDYGKNLPAILPSHGHHEEFPVNDSGFITVNLAAFQEKKRCLHINVKGTDLDKIVYLDGPKLKVEWKKGAGFWKNFIQ